MPSIAPRPAATANADASYRMLWRWHFYAGLFVMPFLIVLAVTGTLYCFQPQIEPLLYPHVLKVEPSGERLSAQRLLDRAREAAPAGATVTNYTLDTDPRASAEFVFRLPAGGSDSVYLNPYSGAYLGSLSVEDRLMKQVRMLHRALLVGKPGELLMELAACWVLVMIATGLAMWWPRLRQRGARAFVPGPATGTRGGWKEIHLALGAWLAVGALAFILSGLPWTGSWGKQFKALATAANLGRPADGQGDMHAHAAPPASGADHMKHHHTMESLPLADMPWAVGLTTVPSVAPAKTAPLSLDQVVAVVANQGITTGCQVVFPKAPGGVYTASCFPADPRGERTLHIDPANGRVVKDLRFDDYGPVAQAISYGTSLHMGRYFGLANQLICAAISLGLMAMAVTGLVMWIQRKPARKLGAPSHPAALPPMRAWAIGLGLLGAVFPMMGVTLLAVWLLDRRIAGAGGVRTAPTV
ncbi:PepSY-associated TM helix domain-containing protein [Cupriavidus sp. 2KB_3]|uniref:PepSY-associated TM helix domain-containing protein n=1 Tax=Cupriavidus sp. 2KB_3 TaxID=3232980 RepID=UPI003F90BBAF